MAIGALLLGLFTVIDPHVRTTTPDLRTLVREGAQRSATFRALVTRLDASDVVVYVEYDYRSMADVRGFVTFISAAGGRRYVRVRIEWQLPREHQLAILGHTGWRVLKEIRRREPRPKPEAPDAHNLHGRHAGVPEASSDGSID